jgi:hypothetical protein
MITNTDEPTAPKQTNPRGRPRKYLTEEEWREAKRLNSRNTYKTHPEEMKAARQAYKKEHADAVKIKAKERYERKKDADKVERLLNRIKRLVGDGGMQGARGKLLQTLSDMLKEEKMPS